MHADRSIAETAARQHGVFSYAQAETAGFTRSAIAHRRSAGRWLAIRRGVYTLAGSPSCWEQHILAGVLAYGPKAAAAGISAGALWKLIEERPKTVHVVLPAGQHRERRNGVVLHRGTLRRSDVRIVDAIPVTAPNRTLVDLAGTLSGERLEAALDIALERGLTSLVSLRRYIDDRRLGSRRGVGRLRSLIEDRARGVPGSELERIFLRKLRASGLPEPVRQFPVGRKKIDMAYPDQRIIIELDGLGSRFTGPALRADRRRQNEVVLALPGWTLLRFTWDDVTKCWPRVEKILRERVG